MKGSTRPWKREHVADKLHRAALESICSIIQRRSSSASPMRHRAPVAVAAFDVAIGVVLVAQCDEDSSTNTGKTMYIQDVSV